MSDNDMRFSDEKLEKFYQEFTKLAEDFKAHELREAERDDEFKQQQAENTRVLAELRDNTADLVQAWGDAQSAIRLGSALGRLFKWASGIGVAVVGLYALLGDKFKL